MSELTPVELEVMRHALAGIAEEMGIALQRSAYSPNIKERVDCSAAVFDPDGNMVAQAEHIPVHLGSMPASVAAVITAYDDLAPGDQVMLNDPYAGGNHLPDLTMVAAVGDADGGLLGYVANRAHQADVGGSAPGSMPADATEIAAEGIRVPPVRITERAPDGTATVRQDLLNLFAANSRTPAERHGDLRAQLAANHVGAARLAELAGTLGRDRVAQGMHAVRDYADRRVRAAIAEIPDGQYTATDVLEVVLPEGEPGVVTEVPITATVTVAGDGVTVDFDGTGHQVRANVNAVLAVTTSAVWFAFRMVTDPDAPPNEGCYRACTVTAPEGTVTNAVFPAPVAAGNVETSQRVADVVLAAFAEAVPDRVPAASQGTMNNTLLGAAGGDAFSYYETLAGGEGGTPERPGMAAIQTGMTNTKNTPAEAMELAYPLRVWRNEVRHGSGGAGLHPGGDGMIREIEALEPAVLTLLTQRRVHGPPGRSGGASGAPGRNLRISTDGTEHELPPSGTWRLEAGERVRVETPGGGGWGAPPGQ